RANIIERVEKSDRGRDQNECDHQRSPDLIDAAKQAIEGNCEADENHLPDEVGENRKTKHGLVSKDIIRCRSSVPAHDKFVRNVNETERTCDDHRCIDRAGDARGFLEWVHGFLRCCWCYLLAGSSPSCCIFES